MRISTLTTEIYVDFKELLLIFLGVIMALWSCIFKINPYILEIRTEIFRVERM